tara:strand:- start:676 stop:1014 length:339 start_codon:yes stop_codon:yes gene_type:complete
MKTEIDVKKYRKDQTIKLIEKYKSLIDDVFEVFEDNVPEIEEDEKEDSEEKKLNRIKKRSAALEHVDGFLLKIENLEHHLKEAEENSDDETVTTKKEEPKGFQHPTKARAKN